MCLGEEVLEIHPTGLESHGIHLACFVEVAQLDGQYLKSTLNPHAIITGFFCCTTASGKEIFDANEETQELQGMIHVMVKCRRKNTCCKAREV